MKAGKLANKVGHVSALIGGSAYGRADGTVTEEGGCVRWGQDPQWVPYFTARELMAAHARRCRALSQVRAELKSLRLWAG